MKTRSAPASLALLLMIVTPALADEPGQDNPLVSRFQGATMHAYEESDYEAIALPAAPVPGDAYHGRSGWVSEVLQDVMLSQEGRVSWISYLAPEGKSTLEILRNYESALQADHFEILFSCTGQPGCGQNIGRYVNTVLYPSGYWSVRGRHVVRPGFVVRDNTRVMLAGRSDDHGTAHVFLYLDDAMNPPAIHQVVVEGEPMQTGQVQTGVRNADELQAALDAEGKVIVDGIYFDYDSAEIRPESTDALEQMAQLLEEQPRIEVLIVGHTDNQGGYDYNTGLSQRRADAVRQILIRDYGIDGRRMTAVGVSFAAPIASNRSETGRTLNRRVELVLK